MKSEIASLIRSVYPAGIYTRRRASLLDRHITDSSGRDLAAAIESLGHGEGRLGKDTNYDVCYRLSIAHPGWKAVSGLQHFSPEGVRRKVAVPADAYITLILLSRLDRYYTMNWNLVSAKGGEVRTEFRVTPPTPHLERFAKEVRGLLRERKWRHLERKELREEVPWLKAGDSIVKNGRVTVYNCLFSEI